MEEEEAAVQVIFTSLLPQGLVPIPLVIGYDSEM